MNKFIRNSKKKYKTLQEQISLLEDKLECIQDPCEKELIKKQLKIFEESFDLFIREEYAKIVFDVYYSKNPKIKDIYTGQIKLFSEIYGTSFEKMPKGLKEGLVGLTE